MTSSPESRHADRYRQLCMGAILLLCVLVFALPAYVESADKRRKRGSGLYDDEPDRNSSPALSELMSYKISVFDLYLDDLLVAGRSAFASTDDPFNPILETVDYDADQDRVILFFTLDPDTTRGRAFDKANAELKKQILTQEAETLAVIAGCAPLPGMDEGLGLIHLTPFRGVKELSEDASMKAKGEIAARTIVIVQMERGRKAYFVSRNPDGSVRFRESS